MLFKIKLFPVLLAGIAALAVSGCEKVEKGFLSDGLRYKSPDLLVDRGVTKRYDGILFDGSTPPVTFELKEIRPVGGGKLSAEFNTKTKVWLFKQNQKFVAATDTTLALLRANNGSFLFTKASINLPLGRYEFDVEANNLNGKRFFKNIGQLVIQDHFSDITYAADCSGYDSVTAAFSSAKVVGMTVKRLNTTGTKVILKMTDKNGKIFNPKAGQIIGRGDRPILESYSRFNKVEITDTAMICDYAIAPFPLAYVAGYGSYLMYYRIPAQFIKMDDAPAAKVWAANPRFGFQVLVEGTYEVEIKLTNVEKL
jgi:hypothetical protein